MKLYNEKRSLFILFILWVVALSFLCFFSDSIYFFGEKEITLEVYSEYNEPGGRAYSQGLYVDYETIGSVDTSTVGDYSITYFLPTNPKVFATRIVHVVDTTLPEITFLNESGIFDISDENRFNDYTIRDNYDENPTLTITIPQDCNDLGQYDIIYTVTDCCGNTTKVTRQVTIADTIAPTLTINRKVNAYAILNQPIDLSCFAYDGYDGDISNNIIVEGDVDFSTKGLYTVKYTIFDSSNNKTQLITTVNVQPANKKGIPVLMYHWFYDDLAGETYPEYLNHNYIAKSTLIEQLQYLVSEHYYFADFNELRDYIDGKIQLPEKTIIMTDDDATETFFKIALPVFIEYNVPVTSFTSTARFDYWLNYQDIDVLTYQSHSHNMHTKIKGDFAVYKMSYEEMVIDCQTSIERIGHNDALAYPYGYFTDDYIKAVQDCGFKVCFTTEYGRVKKGDDPYLLDRIRINRTLTLKQFINTVK